jgi:hypothetical protein
MVDCLDDPRVRLARLRVAGRSARRDRRLRPFPWLEQPERLRAVVRDALTAEQSRRLAFAKIGF